MQNLGGQTKSIVVFSEVAYIACDEEYREVKVTTCPPNCIPQEDKSSHLIRTKEIPQEQTQALMLKNNLLILGLNDITKFKQPRRLRQIKLHLKINAYAMMTILQLLLFAHILYGCQTTLKMEWWGCRRIKHRE